MWLVGVVVRRYIDILIIIINFPYSTCNSSFFGSSIPASLYIEKKFFVFITFRQRKGYIYIYTCIVKCTCICMCIIIYIDKITSLMTGPELT